MRVAALTMAYNEKVWAPVWARHYARQVRGAEHCYLLDHGSDDGSTDGLGINVERLARSTLDEDVRAATVSARAAALLEHYDAVVHADIDELVMPDPARYEDLVGYAEGEGAAVVTAVGLDVQHLAREEQALDPAQSIGAQRRWVRFSAAMCKPAFIRRRVLWAPGFHWCDRQAAVSDLYLLHLRLSDTELGLERLGRTREYAFATAELDLHQRVSDHEFRTMLESIAQLPKVAVPFDTREGPIAAWMGRVALARQRGADWMSLAGDQLWELPERFAAAF